MMSANIAGQWDQGRVSNGNSWLASTQPMFLDVLV
jgi:hypothetical protein